MHTMSTTGELPAWICYNEDYSKCFRNTEAGIKKTLRKQLLKVLEKCTKNLIGHSRLAFNNHESNIDC